VTGLCPAIGGAYNRALLGVEGCNLANQTDGPMFLSSGSSHLCTQQLPYKPKDCTLHVHPQHLLLLLITSSVLYRIMHHDGLRHMN
jgi:hypothetical protein